jgi:hypothetical protein
MEKTQEESVWSELWHAIKYCKESKKGKYSIDTYLDIVGEYTDRQIKTAEENGLKYLGGECKISNSFDTNTYDFDVKMFFEDSQGENIAREAKRSLPKEKFVSETYREIGDEIKFEITRPE